MSLLGTYHKRLVAYMLLLVVFLIAVLIVTYNTSRIAITEQASENLDRFTRQVASNISLEARTLDQHVQMIRNNIELTEYMFVVVSIGSPAKPLKSFFKRNFGWLPVGHALIYSRKGKVLLGGIHKEFSEAVYKKIQTDRPTEQSFVIYDHDIIHLLAVAPVYYQGEFLGNIVLARDLDRKWMTQIANESVGEIFLVSDNKVVWSTIGDLPPVTKFKAHKESQVIAGNRYYVKQIILLPDSKGPIIWFGLRADKLTKALARNSYFLLVAALVGSAAILITGLLLLRNFRKPLRDLLDQMEEVESGSFPKIKKVPYNDEISQLTNQFSGMVGSLKKQQQKIEAINEQLAEQASTDVLTGLFNRRHLYDLFPKLLSEAHRNKQQLIVMLADLDKFKLINDTFGHPFGDQCLQHFADVMKDCCRTNDFLFRMGGEEFLILSIGSFDGGMVLAEKIRKSLSRSPLKHNKKKVTVTVSIGVSIAPEVPGPEVLNEVLAMVDKALYEAKERGRNRVAVFTAA